MKEEDDAVFRESEIGLDDLHALSSRGLETLDRVLGGDAAAAAAMRCDLEAPREALAQRRQRLRDGRGGERRRKKADREDGRASPQTEILRVEEAPAQASTTGGCEVKRESGPSCTRAAVRAFSAGARRSRAGAASDRRGRGTPSPRPSARRAAARRGRGGRGPRGSPRCPRGRRSAAPARIVAVGLKATRKTMSSPLLMPPCTPPERLVRGAHAAARSVVNGSLCSMPVRRVPAKPLPISKPFDAGSDSIALREVGLELVEHRLAQPGGHAAADALDDAAERVAGAPRRVDARDHRSAAARRRGSGRCSPRRRRA